MRTLDLAEDLASEYFVSVDDIRKVLSYMGVGNTITATGKTFVYGLDKKKFNEMMILHRWKKATLNHIENNPGTTRYALHQELISSGAGNIGLTGVETILAMLTHEYVDIYEGVDNKLYIRGCDRTEGSYVWE